MANVFAITTVSDKLKAETGSVSTVFTVTNTTPRPLRGVAKIKPLGNTESSWIKIDGETERDFPPAGTHQYTVSFNKPGPVTPPAVTRPAESFQFRLDIISTANPDEDFTEGQIVTVEIPEQKVEEKKPFPWWMVVAGAAVLLIVAGVVIWLVVRNPGIEVPDLTGKTFAEAEAQLNQINSDNATNLTIEKAEPAIAPDKEINKIFEQDPVAGTKAEDTTVIKVSVPATVSVPRVIKSTYTEAKSQLEGAGLTISGHIRTLDAPKTFPDNLDLISFQSPLSGTVKKGTEVQVFSPCKTNPCFKILDIGGIKVIEGVKKDLLKLKNQ